VGRGPPSCSYLQPLHFLLSSRRTLQTWVHPPIA
jgi:hypothetical protein